MPKNKKSTNSLTTEQLKNCIESYPYRGLIDNFSCPYDRMLSTVPMFPEQWGNRTWCKRKTCNACGDEYCGSHAFSHQCDPQKIESMVEARKKNDSMVKGL